MERSDIIKMAGEAIAAAWLAEEVRASRYNVKPTAERLFIVAQDVLCRFYDHRLEQDERHAAIFTVATAALERMREEKEAA